MAGEEYNTILADTPIRFAIKEREIKNNIVKAIFSIPEYLENQNDIMLLNYVMNLIELSVKKKYKIDKLQLLMAIYIEAFGALNANIIGTLKKNVDYLLASKAVIVVTRFTRMYYKMKHYFRTKI
jgi:hypothetical protein